MTVVVKVKLVFGQWEGGRMTEAKKGKRQQLGESEECGVKISGMTADREQSEQDRRIGRQRRTNRSSTRTK